MLKALLLAGCVTVGAALTGANFAADESPHHEHFMSCAKACADCQLQCDTCFHHCAMLVTDGKQEHAKCMLLCVDCGDCCKLAASLAARHSPLAGLACDCCAKCCDECATACEKLSNDKEMAACAKECRGCAKACREMLKHSGSK